MTSLPQSCAKAGSARIQSRAESSRVLTMHRCRQGRARFTLIALLLLTGCAPAVLYFGRSPDRRRTVRVVELASKQYVELDGVGEVGYRAVGVEGLVFSADG